MQQKCQNNLHADRFPAAYFKLHLTSAFPFVHVKTDSGACVPSRERPWVLTPVCMRLRGSALGLSGVVGKWEGCFVLWRGGSNSNGTGADFSIGRRSVGVWLHSL